MGSIAAHGASDYHVFLQLLMPFLEGGDQGIEEVFPVVAWECADDHFSDSNTLFVRMRLPTSANHLFIKPYALTPFAS